MATGDVAVKTAADSTDNTSAPDVLDGPFNIRQLLRIDEALAAADERTGLTFSVYVGSLHEPTVGAARGLHDRLADPANSILIAVSPQQRKLEIVTGENVVRRIPDRNAALAALSMTASFGGGDLTRGVVEGLRMLADQAAP
ncbi:uncharacterized protein DUF5130 [Stackebrandtia endophytica]|uniref:Uncharacterized protein DUF5130 n=1 Tax=Stackebrandtia endophytica TaxID=1496996 RepID=A0A543ASJ9_9ACTN|nr:DUF5130 family protein [Stackebrandtia endophytica]TQL75561.1 uncharacterized protein DUF5130 [Stackebrandtia endophytica]